MAHSVYDSGAMTVAAAGSTRTPDLSLYDHITIYYKAASGTSTVACKIIPNATDTVGVNFFNIGAVATNEWYCNSVGPAAGGVAPTASTFATPAKFLLLSATNTAATIQVIATR